MNTTPLEVTAERTHRWTMLECGHRVHHAKTDPAPACTTCTAALPMSTQRCCDMPEIEAVWGMGTGENNIITITCLYCGADYMQVWP